MSGENSDGWDKGIVVRQWKSVALSEICQIKPPKKEAKEQLSDTDLVSFVPMKNLGICTKSVVLRKDRQLGKVSGSYTYFANNDVLLAKITPCFENGKLGIARDLTNGIGFGSSEYIVFRATAELDPEYLFYFLSQDSFRDAGARMMTGAVGHKRVSKEFIKNQQIPLPPLPEQKRIIAILDEIFAGITKAVANAEKNLSNARELFESYLNNVFTQKGEGWKESILGDTCDLFQGLAINKGTKHLLVKHSSLPLLRIKDLRNDTQEQYICKKGFPPNALTKKDDLIYTRTGQIGLVFRGRYGVLHNNCFKIVPKDCMLRGYLFWWLQGVKFKEEIVRLASRAAQPDITHKLFKAQPIVIPPLKHQESVVAAIEEIYANIQQLETIYQQKLTALAELKQSILQKAFAGELTADMAPQEVSA